MSPRKPSGGPRRSAGGPRPSASGRSGSRGRRPGPPPTPQGEPRVRPIPSDRRGRTQRSAPRRPSAPDRRGVGGEQVEGRHAVLELLLAGARRVQEVWISAAVEDAPIVEDIRTVAEDNRVPVREVGQGKFAAQARCEAPQGVLALAAPLPELGVEDLLAGQRLPSHTGRRPGPGAGRAPFLLALDGVTDPGNLGAVLRSAECAGVTGVVLPRHRAVHVTPAATKSAAGAVEHLPIALVGGIPSALAQLKEKGMLAVGLDSQADHSIYELPPVDGPVCLVLGSEGRGLSRLVRQRCDVLAQIPLYGQLASLNVAVAGALACFEVARQRG